MSDYLQIHTKHLVYSSGMPLPFCVYEGMLESIYMISNSVAFSSVCSPGLYKVMRDFVFGTGAEHVVIVDDLLGLTGGSKQDRAERPTWTLRFIEQLSALNRIAWKCPHVENPGRLDTSRPGVYWQATPLAFLHENRIPWLNVETVNQRTDSWFIFPIGSSEKASTALAFYLTFVKRPVYTLRVPAALIDDTFVCIPPSGETQIPVVRGIHVERAYPPQGMQGAYTVENEKRLYRFLYG